MPLVDIPPRKWGEPTLKIPQPPGWEFVQIDEGDESARFELANPALSAHPQTAPNAVVTLGTDPRYSSAQELFDEADTEMINIGFEREMKPSAATVCGQPAQLGKYTIALEGMSNPVFAKVLLVAAQSESESYLANLFVATSEPDNPIYQRDSQAILDGFVFLPPIPGGTSG
ncbi:MAG: LpqN/LpqT family lipoprotein [Mycolicibacterium sp.]|uniref:LpqN/LpqT family lipoprotein n=1 Tax=Mycolicibacterium sp. TaxID=2320850 RepID=UPI003D11B496